MAKTVGQVFGNPSWLPETFDLYNPDELALFTATYHARAAAGLDNHWICKPWNYSRGKEIVISEDLPCILKLGDTPRVACKYIERPATLHIAGEPAGAGHKFDLRFLVFARVSPNFSVEINVYNTFWMSVISFPPFFHL